jgi:hypothetical protein
VTRPHTVSITEFGAVGDGKFLNTHAFENAIFYLRVFFFFKPLFRLSFRVTMTWLNELFVQGRRKLVRR